MKVATVVANSDGIGVFYFWFEWIFAVHPGEKHADWIGRSICGRADAWVVSAFQLAGGILLLVNRYVPLSRALLAPVIVNILTYHVLLDHNEAAPGLLWRSAGEFCFVDTAQILPGFSLRKRINGSCNITANQPSYTNHCSVMGGQQQSVSLRR